MKPRLAPAYETDEDEIAWSWVCFIAVSRLGPRFAARLVSPDADRRDAWVMWAAAHTGEVEVQLEDQNGVFCDYVTHRFSR